MRRCVLRIEARRFRRDTISLEMSSRARASIAARSPFGRAAMITLSDCGIHHLHQQELICFPWRVAVNGIFDWQLLLPSKRYLMRNCMW